MAGHVTHYEISATDVDRAQRFWSGVMGWSFGDSVVPGMEYRMAQIADGSGAALSSSGEPGHPNVYFDVDDIDASLATIRELGGSAEDKAPVPGMGWFAACIDTEGNRFSIWQTDAGAG